MPEYRPTLRRKQIATMKVDDHSNWTVEVIKFFLDNLVEVIQNISWEHKVCFEISKYNKRSPGKVIEVKTLTLFVEYYG